MKRSEIPYFIATLLINELSDGNRNVAECEKGDYITSRGGDNRNE